MTTETINFTVVILTYNRKHYLEKQIEKISLLKNCEIIIVDNCSDEPYLQDIKSNFPNIKTIFLEKNYGAVGRNFGIQAALGDIIVTLDDDIYGLSEQDLHALSDIFNSDKNLKAICFKVLDEKTNNICNWCHPKDPLMHSDSTFETCNISEGAVAFKRDLFDEIDVYPWEFFISHEGPDLAYRILNAGYKTIYTPRVSVVHAYADEGRKSWRRYYYDTRNLVLLSYRNYNGKMLVKKLPLQLVAMFIFSFRDGFLKYYFKALFDGVRQLFKMKEKRNPITKEAYIRIVDINRERPPLSYYVKKRLLKKGVKI